MCTNSNTQPSNGQQLSPDAFIENSQNDTQKMNTFTAYEKAIEGIIAKFICTDCKIQMCIFS